MICPACQAENEEAHEVCLSCGQSLAGGQALSRGSVVASRYEILSPLGRGGMGMVFKARDRVLDENVALKILRADVARAPDLERRFRSEIKLARRVRHRNVCGIHEYGEDGTLRYIAMELVEGIDLKALLRDKGAIPTREAYEVAIQLTQGLEAIHEAGVVHRDLKASNVMLDSQGRVRLMDFGIAKQLGGEATLGATAIGHIVGTPEYMSPEQARGDKIDSRSDLYALGIVIYEIFTGHVPFQGDTPIATIFKTLEQPPVLEGPSAAGIPEPMVSVLAKALAKEPAGRFGSAHEMMEAIKAARQRSSPDAVTPAPLEVATLKFSAGMTEVPRPAPTPVPTPTPRPSKLVAPTTVLRRQQEPTTILAPPPPPRRPASADARWRSASASRPTPQPSRSVWPWLLAAGLALSVVAGGIVLLLNMLLTSDKQATPERQPRATAEARVSATPAPSPRASAEPPKAESSPTPKAPTSSAARIVDVEPTPSAPTRGVPQMQRPSPAVAARTKIASAPATTSPRASAPLRPAASSTPLQRGLASPVTEDGPGLLQLRVSPWAAVSVDDAYVGTTPLQPLFLSPGSHTVRLTHPDYKPLQRKLTIRSGETTRLEIDLTWEAVPRQP